MKNILVIENDSSILENTIEILELKNYQVLAASNGEEGLNIARKIKPDHIFMRHSHAHYGWLESFTGIEDRYDPQRNTLYIFNGN